MTQPAPPVAESTSPRSRPAATSPLLVGLAWLVVGLPAAWGVTQTVIKSMALFHNTPPAAAAPLTAPSPAAK